MILLLMPHLKKERKKERDNLDVATHVNYGFASSSSWSKSICNPKMGHYENEFTPVPRLVPPLGFKGKHLEGHIQAGQHLYPTPLGSHRLAVLLDLREREIS